MTKPSKDRKRIPTVREVAAQANVSPTTVSYVANGRGRVSEATRQRVVDAMKALGYAPNYHARALVQRQTQVIAVVIPRHADAFTDPYFTQLLRGIASQAEAVGYLLMIGNWPNGLNKDAEHRLLGHVDGVIVTEATLNEPGIRQLQEAHLPFVLVGGVQDPTIRDYVTTDGSDGMYQAVQYLYRCGHQAIAFLASPMRYKYSVWRLEGYRKALVDLGLSYNAQLIVEGDATEQGGFHATLELLAHAEGMFSAIIASTDLMAIGAMRALQRKHLSVPEHISLVGFDDSTPAQYTQPRLSTLRQDIVAVGKGVANMLIQKLTGRPYQSPIILPVRLIIRDSVRVIPPKLISTADDPKNLSKN